MSKIKLKQTESHDWLGEAAECLARYYLTKDSNFTAFGAGKWGPDILLLDKKGKTIVLVEVRSTDKNRWPKLTSKIKQKIRKLPKHIKKTFMAVRLVSGGAIDSRRGKKLGEIWIDDIPLV